MIKLWVKLVQKARILPAFKLNVSNFSTENRFAIALIASSLSTGSAQILGTGNCPAINVTENFSLPRFVGKWFEIRAYPYLYTLGSSCVSWTFTGADGNGTLGIETRHTRLGSERVDVGVCEIVRPGVLLLSYPNSTIVRADSNVYVLATDYENYAVLYSCSHALFVNAKNAWILSRKSTLENDHLESAMAAIDRQGLLSSLLTITLQSCGSA